MIQCGATREAETSQVTVQRAKIETNPTMVTLCLHVYKINVPKRFSHTFSYFQYLNICIVHRPNIEDRGNITPKCSARGLGGQAAITPHNTAVGILFFGECLSKISLILILPFHSIHFSRCMISIYIQGIFQEFVSILSKVEMLDYGYSR